MCTHSLLDNGEELDSCCWQSLVIKHISTEPVALFRTHCPISPQVTKTVLGNGEELESTLVVVGVGARPNTQLLKGQLDVEDQKPGGIPVRLQGLGDSKTAWTNGRTLRSGFRVAASRVAAAWCSPWHRNLTPPGMWPPLSACRMRVKVPTLEPQSMHLCCSCCLASDLAPRCSHPQVNGRLQTSDPDVYAIGDIALFPQPRFGNSTARQEHVQVTTCKHLTQHNWTRGVAGSVVRLGLCGL